jgi:hypothetical protein
MTAGAPRKIFVLEVRPERHCLGGVFEPRVLPLPLDHPRPGDNHIVMLPIGKDLSVLDDTIPDAAWARARIGLGKVVFDASEEGHAHTPERTHKLHQFLARLGIEPAQAVYITQDRGYGAAYSAHCRASGVGSPMKVVVFDNWIREISRQNEARADEEFQARLDAYRRRPRQRRWRFLSLNRTLRATKVLFLLRLMEDGLWDQGAISVGGLERLVDLKGRSQAKIERRLFALEPFADLNTRLQPLWPQLRAIGEIGFHTERSDPKFGPLLDDPLAEYGQSWFSVVTESEMRDRPSRITEKPLKPLMNFHPLIVLGNPGALGLLRAYGFQTHAGLFDESYDEEPDPRRRFEMVYQQVRRLCAMDEAELDGLERTLDETLVFNARHALVELPRMFRERLDPALVADILAPSVS